MDNRTKEIISRFTQSWDDTEKFYNRLIEEREGFYFLRPIKEYIQALRSDGGDSCFRLGTSLHTLIISRSVDHGLRKDQKFIRIESFFGSKLSGHQFRVMLMDGDKVYRDYTVSSLDNPLVARLLNTLKHTLAD